MLELEPERVEIDRQQMQKEDKFSKVLQKEIQKEQSFINSGQIYREKLINDLKSLEEEQHTEEDVEKLEKYKRAFAKLEEMKADCSDKKYYFDLAEILLKDSGIKTKIINKLHGCTSKSIRIYFTIFINSDTYLF